MITCCNVIECCALNNHISNLCGRETTKGKVSNNSLVYLFSSMVESYFIQVIFRNLDRVALRGSCRWFRLKEVIACIAAILWKEILEFHLV